MKNLFLGLLFLNSTAWALPGNLEVWFLSSPKKSAFLLPIEKPSTHLPLLLVQNDVDMYNCLPMDNGYCFHPQTGMHVVPGATPSPEPEDKSLGVKNALEHNMIKCDPNNYFDLFCGEAGPDEVRPSSYALEIWVDVSSSLREVDYSMNGQSFRVGEECYRKNFISRVSDKCGAGNLRLSTFDTSKRELGSLNTLCQSRGSNDQKRLIRWIKENNSQNLIVVTDISEASNELTEFVYSVGGTLRGYQKNDEIFANRLHLDADKAAKYCNRTISIKKQIR